MPTNDLRLKLEIIGGLLLLALCVAGFMQWQANQVAQGKAEVLHEQQAIHDADIKKLTKEQSDRDADYAKQIAATKQMTPQQIVVKVPEYIPAVTSPISVLGENSSAVQSGEAHTGDAIVPKADLQPIIENAIAGKKCSEDLLSCKASTDDWKDKYRLKDKESDDWKKAAKGGSALKRVWSTTWKIGIGLGIGYAIKH